MQHTHEVPSDGKAGFRYACELCHRRFVVVMVRLEGQVHYPALEELPEKPEPVNRKAYDDLHCMYPWEHPSAYWLRASVESGQILCTRCGLSIYQSEVAVLRASYPAFVELHMKCELGGFYGKDTHRGVLVVDPIFNDKGGDDAGSRDGDGGEVGEADGATRGGA